MRTFIETQLDAERLSCSWESAHDAGVTCLCTLAIHIRVYVGKGYSIVMRSLDESLKSQVHIRVCVCVSTTNNLDHQSELRHSKNSSARILPPLYLLFSFHTHSLKRNQKMTLFHMVKLFLFEFLSKKYVYM